MALALGLSEHLTYKGNLQGTRYGWLRLTPAYSLHLVSEILEGVEKEEAYILDPFCGTGTTALACAERGIRSATTDINPFLIWLARAKAYPYTAEEIREFQRLAEEVGEALAEDSRQEAWMPPLHQIEKWWDAPTLQALCRASHAIACLERQASCAAIDLLKIAFCRLLIGNANVSFGHQSMSFKKAEPPSLALPFLENELQAYWERSVSLIANAAASPILQPPCVTACDARELSATLEAERYTCVITSPPYPNRMSYIRELRPYMYWLGYLDSGRMAGEMDWQAIGGTWGCATSNLSRWEPQEERDAPYPNFTDILERIGSTSPLLARYVQKYFYDMTTHSRELYKVVKAGGRIHYIVGNSKFYDVMLPVEEIFASLFRQAGFVNVTATPIRKRTSKKELFEYLVMGEKPR